MQLLLRKRKLRAQWVIATVLLLLPLAAAIKYFVPNYYSFTAMGDIVSVREIGVNGSVHFVYVMEGVTRNDYEKLSVMRAYPDAAFVPVDRDSRSLFEEHLQIEENARNETIRHALESTADLMESDEADGELEARLSLLIEETGQYYGNSIGLMLGIGLVEEVSGEDFSRGGAISIAGTGTLEEDHTVGSVGGIRDKLRTAEKNGTDLFFIPHDIYTYEYAGLSNEEEAAQVVQELGLHVQVVPVSSLEGAIAYLRAMH